MQNDLIDWKVSKYTLLVWGSVLNERVIGFLFPKLLWENGQKIGKKWSTLLTTRELQIKIMRRYSFIHLCRAVMKKARDRCWQGYRERRKGNAFTPLMGIYFGTGLENYVEVPKSLKMESLWFRNPATRNMSKGYEISISKRYLHSCVHCSAIHRS